jgi:hypothetical protein
MSEVTSENVPEIEKKLTKMLRREAKKAKAPLEKRCPADMFSPRLIQDGGYPWPIDKLYDELFL